MATRVYVMKTRWSRRSDMSARDHKTGRYLAWFVQIVWVEARGGFCILEW